MSPRVVDLLNTCAATRHFRERARERGLSREIEEFVVTWGTSIEGPYGAHYFTVVRRDLPFELQDHELTRRAEGWVFVVAEDGALVTCYRTKDAWRHLRRAREERGRGRRAA